MSSMLPNLSAKQLRAVQAVARYSSFIAASAELRMSQPGLSRVIQAVEDELGIQLFHRNTRHVTLTSAGMEFLPIVDRILLDFDLAAEALTSLRDQKRGHVVVACPMSIAHRLADVISDYRRRHPNVFIEIREALRGDVVEQIRLGHADFGLASFMQSEDDLVVEELCETTYHVVFRKDHPFLGRKKVALADLKDEPLVSLPPHSILRRIFDGAAAREGFRLDHVLTVNTHSTIFEFIRRGDGVSIQNGASLGFKADELLATRPIDPPRITSKLAAIYLKNRPMSPAALGLKSAMANFFRAMVQT
jgi:LysR family transcriptional regulator, carnitine catabolism transcriptional activator